MKDRFFLDHSGFAISSTHYSSKYVKFDLIWLKNNFEIDIFFTNMLAGKHRACFSVIDDTRQSQHFRMTSRLKEFHIFSYVTNSLINYSSLFEVLQKQSNPLVTNKETSFGNKNSVYQHCLPYPQLAFFRRETSIFFY